MILSSTCRVACSTPNFVRMTLPTRDQAVEVLRRIDQVLARLRPQAQPQAVAAQIAR